MDPAGPDLIVPVPLYPRRLAWRGFNQSLELARLLAADLNRPVLPGALRRIRDTTPQSQLPGARRRANIAGVDGTRLNQLAKAIAEVCTR